MRNLANETQKSKEAGTEDCRNHPIDRRQSDSYDAVPPREALEGAESVILEKTDAGDLVKRIQDTAKDVDAMNVDQELRLTLLEMGISSTDAQAF